MHNEHDRRYDNCHADQHEYDDSDCGWFRNISTVDFIIYTSQRHFPSVTFSASRFEDITFRSWSWTPKMQQIRDFYQKHNDTKVTPNLDTVDVHVS
jgi:hypothetical protein